MSVAKFSRKDCSKNEIERKLKVYEYVFEIDGKDIFDASVIYSIDNIEMTRYNDGKKQDIIIEPIISIELNGKDKFGNDAWVSFELNTDVNYLNTLSKEPTDIINLLSENESFIKKPDEEFSGYLEFNIPKYTEDDIYKKITSLWILKIEENEFIIKLCVPNELFTYFKIIFEK